MFSSYFCLKTILDNSYCCLLLIFFFYDLYMYPYSCEFIQAYKGKTVSAFTARALIKRSDWGMTRAAPLMSDEIEITIESEMILKN